MKHWILAAALSTISCTATLAQDNKTEATQLSTQARTYLTGGDYSNAILVFKQATVKDPYNLDYKRDLAYAYYLNGEMESAQKTITPVINSGNSDAQSFVIAGSILEGMNNFEDAKKVYKKGLRQYPEEGALYNAQGEMLARSGDNKSALESWVKGIDVSPNFYLNYYNAARTYDMLNQPFWAIFYGEIYVNLDPYSAKTTEAKRLILENYKRLFSSIDQYSKSNPQTFEARCLDLYRRLAPAMTGGVNVENLILMRSRFVLEWMQVHQQQFPYGLIEMQNSLMAKGYFDAYNVWLFGLQGDKKAYDAWMKENSGLMAEFLPFQKAHKFTLRSGENYNAFTKK